MPDGEPHVFGGRLYVYGSHDRRDGTSYCQEDYVVWSAPVDDLSQWRCEGVSYHRTDDPRHAAAGGADLMAPDVAQGPDGRYYLEAVAAAGRAESPLPLAVNCWFDKGHKPGRFPTGGPVARVMEVWRYAAPTIDVIMPDIYVPYYCDVCDEYRKLGNPLAIPETATYAYASAREIWAVGHHRALCFAPFGFEDMGKPFDASAGVLFGADVSDPAFRIPQDPAEYRAVTERLSGLLSLDPDAYGTSRLDAASRERADEAALAMGAFTVDVTFAAEGLPSAWVADRRLNGDEAAIMRYDEPTLLHVKLFAYA